MLVEVVQMGDSSSAVCSLKRIKKKIKHFTKSPKDKIELGLKLKFSERQPDNQRLQDKLPRK